MKNIKSKSFEAVRELYFNKIKSSLLNLTKIVVVCLPNGINVNMNTKTEIEPNI